MIHAPCHKNAYTALIAAALMGSDSMVRVLLLHGADVNAKEKVRGERGSLSS